MSSTKKLFQNLRDRHATSWLAMTLLINEPLALHTYIKLGGPADFFTVVKSADELAAAVIAAEEAGVKWFILGGGSNILVGDLGFRGLVIKNEAERITLGQEPSLTSRGRASSSMTSKMVSSGQPDTPGYSYLTAESGVLMSKLAAFANQKGLAGLEMFMSVPGTLGGAIFNNSHYRPERNEFIGNLVEEAEILEGRGRREEGRGREGLEGTEGKEGRRIVKRDWFRFGYDYSRLQDEKAVVLRVKFRLRRESPEILRERSLVLMKDRNSHQPIGKPSCGCMFKNPLRIEGSGSDPSGVSAGKLIDSAGLKGVRVGGVSVSGTHANFMVNDGTGKAADVLELMNRVKKRVKEKFGVELIPEIFMIGEFSRKPEEFNC